MPSWENGARNWIRILEKKDMCSHIWTIEYHDVSKNERDSVTVEEDEKNADFVELAEFTTKIVDNCLQMSAKMPLNFLQKISLTNSDITAVTSNWRMCKL